MSEMELVLNNTSQTLLSLAKTLNSKFEEKVLDSLLVHKNSTYRTTLKNNKTNNNFSSHPKRLSSDSLLSVTAKSVKNGFCEDLASIHYNEYFDTNVTPCDSCVSSNTFLRYSKPIIRSPVLSSYSDTQTTLLNREVVEERSNNIVRAAAIIKSKQNKNAFLKPGINGVKSKPSVNKANTTNVLVKPIIITTTCNTSMPLDMDKKLRMEIQKTLGCLEEIRIAMHDGIPTPDGIDEQQRVAKRTTEFVARFGRNYVYSLERHIVDLEKHTRCSDKIALRSVMNIHQSLFLAHHSVVNAFQAYRNNMPACIPGLIIEKLIQVLNKCCLLCDIHKKCINLEKIGGNKRDEMLDVLQNECKLLLCTIEQFMENAINSQLMPKLKSPTRISLKGHLSNRKEIKKRKPRKITSRLSMYSAPPGNKRREGSWLKTFENLSKEHNKYGNVQSKYLTAGYKPRIPIVNAALDKPPFISVPLKTKCFYKKTPGRWRSTPITTARNEDEIQTIVESQKDYVDISDHDSCSEISKKSIKETISPPEMISIPLTTQKSLKEVSCDYGRGKRNKGKNIHALSPYIYELCEQVISSENEAMSQKHLEGLLKGLLGMALNEKIDDRESGSKKNGFVDRNNCHIKFVQGQNSQSPHIHSERNEKSKSLQQKDLSRNKVLGAKNVKSIRSDESLVDRKRKKLTKPCKTVVSANTVSEKNDISKNVDEIQTNTGLLEYVQCCTEKCRKENLDDNVKKKKKIADEIQLNKNKRRQTVTVTGVRNAQLICIKDEDSIVENNGKGRSTKYDRNNNLTLAKTKGMMDAGGKAIKAPSKLSRVPRKDLKQLAFIPKMEALNVIQYKLKYSEYVKGNAMYRKSSCKQPWVIVNSLSECLLNNMLLSIAKEIQVDDILKKLYESEFQ